MAGALRKLGVSDRALEWIKRLLADSGMGRRQYAASLRGLTRVIPEVQSEGDQFELDPKMRSYFEGAGLTRKQIELVQGLARRVALGIESETERRDSK